MIIKLKPILKEKIWGGNNLEEFNYKIDKNKKIGECWGISAHAEGDCLISNGDFEGFNLSYLYKNNPELFSNYKSELFPILIKIIDAAADLSIQVHPDNSYAQKYENSLGKSECWYILNANADSEICLGHNAKTKEELKKLIEENRYSDLLRYQKIKKDDLIAIRPGDIHAILNNTLIYEVQQSSDITYRVYDYNRIDDAGKLRKLHINKALDVINVPFKETKFKKQTIFNNNFNKFIKLYECEFFSCYKLDIKNELEFDFMPPFLCISVIDGSGEVNNLNIKKGDHFLILNSDLKKYLFKGELSLMLTACN